MSPRKRNNCLRRLFLRRMPRLAAFRRRLRSLSVPLHDVMKNKHRIVVIDNDTLKEKFSFQLSGINLFVTLGIVVIVLIVITNVLIIFTPLRQLIPGYINDEMVEQTYRNAQVLDSLERAVQRQEFFIANMQDVVSGKSMPSVNEVRKQSDSLAAAVPGQNETYRHSADDSLLRLEMRRASEKPLIMIEPEKSNRKRRQL